MSDVIDIHPHVISPDTDSFPLKPLGGTQSSWSLKHPLTYDELIAAMDAAGIAKAAVVQASTAYGHDTMSVPMPKKEKTSFDPAV